MDTNYTAPAPAPDSSSATGLANAGMILGIVAWSVGVMSLGFLSWASAALVVTGFPLSIIAYKQIDGTEHPARGRAIAGIALNGAGLGLIAIALVGLIILMFSSAAVFGGAVAGV